MADVIGGVTALLANGLNLSIGVLHKDDMYINLWCHKSRTSVDIFDMEIGQKRHTKWIKTNNTVVMATGRCCLDTHWDNHNKNEMMESEGSVEKKKRKFQFRMDVYSSRLNRGRVRHREESVPHLINPLFHFCARALADATVYWADEADETRGAHAPLPPRRRLSHPVVIGCWGHETGQ